MTVNEILKEANKYVGGCRIDFNSGDPANILVAIVENFQVDEFGNPVDLGLLAFSE